MELTVDAFEKVVFENIPTLLSWSRRPSREDVYLSQKEFVQAIFAHYSGDYAETSLTTTDRRDLAGSSSNTTTEQTIIPCRDFGTVTFSENGNTADFVRVAKDYVKPGDLLEYIRTYCSNQARIEKLGLVVSVHGSVGDKLINESQVLTELHKLRDALSTILVVGSGWVICDGTSSKYSLFKQLEVDHKELQVDPSRTFNYTSIAFVPYECVEGKDVLAGEDEVDLRQYPLIEEERSQKESLHSNCHEQCYQLSGEDTHYIIVDPPPSSNGAKSDTSKEVRSAFELYLAQKYQPKIPIIDIFFGGDIADVISLVEKVELGHDVIVLYGIGGVCDQAVEFLRDQSSADFLSDYTNVVEKLSKLTSSQKLHIIDLKVTNDFEKVFEVASELMSPEKRIKLAIFDTIEGNLAKITAEMVDDPKMNLYCAKAFKIALVDGQFPIIDGLISSGFDISKLFDHVFLRDIYVRAMRRNPAMLDFINGYMPITERNDPALFELRHLEKLLRNLLQISECKITELDVYQHLFLFSVIQLEQSISEFFWRRCREPIAAALFARLLLQKMENSAEFGQKESTLLKMSEHFEVKACEFLNKFAEHEPQMAAENLKSEQKCWFNMKPLNLAERAESNVFFAQYAVNNLNNELFYGRIIPSTSWLRVFLCTVLIFPTTISLPWKAYYRGVFYQMKGVVAQQVIFDRVASRKQKLKSIDPKVKRRLRLALGTLFYSVYTSPITKYIIDTTYQLLFVIAQSYMLTVVYEIQEPLSRIEKILFLLSVTNLFKDWVSCARFEEAHWRHRVQRYYSANKWLIKSTLSSLFFILAITIHAFTYNFSEASELCQVFYIISVFLNYAILLRSCLIWKGVGHYIIMMERMGYDLKVFIVVVLIFTICYGICLQSILFSNQEKSTWSVIFGIALKPVLHIFGDNFLASLAESGNCDPSSTTLFQDCKLTRPISKGKAELLSLSTTAIQQKHSCQLQQFRTIVYTFLRISFLRLLTTVWVSKLTITAQSETFKNRGLQVLRAVLLFHKVDLKIYLA
ncbi:transient receptor potential cation channel subfamily M member 5-like isoform X2 [Convolutriloba macropyga]|uniref:transient receptor potential cation channel subfamily M member 5-like isoform X2 n=1 Tax=Convolutriloba macropyga TaxID=536237 RepID=UPI003F5235A3